MGKFKIYPLDLGHAPRPCERIGLHYQPGVPFTYPVLAFYITDGERKIMLDCGGPETVCEAKMPYSQTSALGSHLEPESLQERKVRGTEAGTGVFRHSL